MAKTKYVKGDAGYAALLGFEDTTGYGWYVHIDGSSFWLGNDSIDEFIDFLKAIKKEGN